MNMRKTMEELGGVIAIAVIAIVILLLTTSLRSSPAGYRAVVTSGPGIGTTYDEGFYWKNPFAGTTKVRVNTQMVTEEISIRAADNVNVLVDFAVRYHLDADNVGDIITENPDYKDTTIISLLRSEARKVVADNNMTTYEMNTRKSFLESELERRLIPLLEDKHITVEDVNLRNLDFPEHINDAWELRAAADVDVQTAEYELAAERMRAQKEIVNAQAEANATVALATGQAEAQRILAEESGNMTNETMNYVLALRYITALRDPESNIQYVIVPNNQALMLNVEGI